MSRYPSPPKRLAFWMENSATVVKDDGMIPLLYPRNYVGGIIVKNIENAIGKKCIVIADNDEIFVRILKHGEEPGRYHLSCLNEHTVLVKRKLEIPQ